MEGGLTVKLKRRDKHLRTAETCSSCQLFWPIDRDEHETDEVGHYCGFDGGKASEGLVCDGYQLDKEKD